MHFYLSIKETEMSMKNLFSIWHAVCEVHIFTEPNI